MPLSMKCQGWKNNIVVEERGGDWGGENVRNGEGWKGIYRWFMVTYILTTLNAVKKWVKMCKKMCKIN